MRKIGIGMCSTSSNREREGVDPNNNSISSHTHSHSNNNNLVTSCRESRTRDGEREASVELKEIREATTTSTAATISTAAEATSSSLQTPAVPFPLLEDHARKGEGNGASSSVDKTESPSDTNLQQDLRCPICMDFFIEPTITDCAHVFCHFCINYWFVNRGRSICPQCRNTVERVVPSPDLTSKVEKYVITHLGKDALEERERVKEVRRRDLNFTMEEVALLEESIMSPYSSAAGDIDDLFWAFTLQQPETSLTEEFTTSVWPSPPVTSNPSAMSSSSFVNSFQSTSSSLTSSQLPSRILSRINSSIPTTHHNPDNPDNPDSPDNPDENRESNLHEIHDTLHQFEYRLDRAQRAYGLLLSAQREMNHQLSHLHSISCRLDRYDRQGIVAAATAAAHSNNNNNNNSNNNNNNNSNNNNNNNSNTRSRNSSTQNNFIPLPLPIPIPDLSLLTSSISQSIHLNPLNPHPAHSHPNSAYDHLPNIQNLSSASSHHPHHQQERDEQNSERNINNNNNNSRNENGRTRESLPTRHRGTTGHTGHYNPNYHYLDPNAMWYWLSSPNYHHASNSRFYPPNQCDLSHHHHRHSSACTYDQTGMTGYGGQVRHGHGYPTPSNYPFHPFHEPSSSTSVHDENGGVSCTSTTSTGHSSSNGSNSNCCRGSTSTNPNLLQEFTRTRSRHRRRRGLERESHTNSNQNHSGSNLSSSRQFRQRSEDFDEDFLEEITNHLADSELAEAIERSLVLDIFEDVEGETPSAQRSSQNLEDEEDTLVDLTLTSPETDIYFQRYSHRDEGGNRHHQSQSQNHHGHSHHGGHHHHHHHQQNSRQRPLH